MVRGGSIGWRWGPAVGSHVAHHVTLAVALAAVIASPPSAQAAYQASVSVNTTAFSSTCLGFSDGFPSKLYDLAVAGYGYLTYGATGYKGTAFTKSRMLGRVSTDLGTYVHSHGDIYGGVQGFREDGGFCTGAPVVHDYDVDAARTTTRPAQLVIMSTCHLGEKPPVGTTGMAASFGIPYGAQNLGAYAFYLGYIGSVFDSDEFKFEQAFWQRVQAGGSSGPVYSLADAFAYAKTHMTFAQGNATWFGNPFYTGWANTSSGCTRCQ